MELMNELAEMKAAIDTVEKERDFYFSKLRDIEVLIQSRSEKLRTTEARNIQDVSLKILYATEDQTVEVDEDGNLIIRDAVGQIVE